MRGVCGNCGAPLQWAAEQGAWYCPKEGTWAQPAQSSHVQQATAPKSTPRMLLGGLTAASLVVGFISTAVDEEENTVIVEADEPNVSNIVEFPELPPGAQQAQEQFGFLDGSAIAPVLTKNITFVTAKAGTTWAEMAFPCYRAAIEMDDGASAADPFYEASPMVKPAFEAAGISIDDDIAAIGGWDCGEGPCFYVAATIKQPKKIGDMLAMFVAEIEEPEPLHWVFEAPGPEAPRNIHVRVLPIEWSGRVPNDDWSTDMARATHVIFLQGLFGGAGAELEAALASGEQAADRVKEAERVLSDTRGRCVLGTVGATDFKPGFALESSHFALGLPPAKSDPIARMMETNRSLNLEIEFALSAAASESEVAGWMDESRAWLAGVAAPLREQFAAQGEMVQVMFDALELVATEGLRHELDGKVLRLSWRTDRVKESSLIRIDADLQRLQGANLGE